jgi:predicted nucleic acid-binding Zn ribbon protein
MRAWRGDRGPRSPEPAAVGEVLAGLLRERVLAQGVSVGRLARRWADVVGERLAAETAPVRLEGGILTVSVSTAAWGAQVRFLVAEVRNGANRTLGNDAVKEVRVAVRSQGLEARKPL